MFKFYEVNEYVSAVCIVLWCPDPPVYVLKTEKLSHLFDGIFLGTVKDDLAVPQLGISHLLYQELTE